MYKKKIWIVKAGEPLIFDSNFERLLRSSTLAHNLSKDSYTVTYFVDSFNHFKKKFRKIRPEINDNVKYKYLNGSGYSKNTSLQRILHNLIISIKFFLKAIKHKPDLVIVSYPPIILAFAVAIFCYFKKIKYIVDFRDSWPDIFTNNKNFKFLLFIFLYPIINFTIKKSYKLTGCAPFFKEFIVKYSNVNQSQKFTYIPHTYYTNSNFENDLKSNFSSNNKVNLVYLGVLSNQRRIGEFIDFFNCYDKNTQMKLFICGNGDLLNSLKTKYESNNVFFTGYIDLIKMNYYSLNADIGIAPYELNEGFITNIPNKIIEYLYYGLPIVTNLKSEIITRLNTSSKNPVVFNYTSKKDLHNHFDTIIKNKNFTTINSKKLIKNIFKEKFGPNVFIKRFEKLFNI